MPTLAVVIPLSGCAAQFSADIKKEVLCLSFTEELDRKMSESSTDFSKYFSDHYLYVWVGLMFIFPPILFIWFPLQVYFFFFYWPKDQASGDGRANGQILHDWQISSLEGDNEERGPVEATEEEWWNLEDVANEGAKAPREEWWKRI